MNYTKPSRNDGCWDVEQECHDEEECDYGPVEIFKLRRGPGPAGRGTHRPICTIENPDMDGTKSECGGNIALIVTAPLVYESLKRAAEMLRFFVNRKNAVDLANEGTALGPKKDGVYGEMFNTMADAEQTLRRVQHTHDALMSGEHVS